MDFYKRVSLVCRQIPQGRAASYGQIALLCGFPKNSRQVGYALRTGRAGEVPAHRVVNSQGILSGAGAFDYPGLQAALLREEGVEVLEGKRVDLKKYGWKNTMEEAVRLKEWFEELGI